MTTNRKITIEFATGASTLFWIASKFKCEFSNFGREPANSISIKQKKNHAIMASARTWESDASILVREGTPVWEGNREPFHRQRKT